MIQIQSNTIWMSLRCFEFKFINTSWKGTTSGMGTCCLRLCLGPPLRPCWETMKGVSRPQIIRTWKWILKNPIGKTSNNIQIVFEEYFFKNSLYVIFDVANNLSKLILYNATSSILSIQKYLISVSFQFFITHNWLEEIQQ